MVPTHRERTVVDGRPPRNRARSIARAAPCADGTRTSASVGAMRDVAMRDVAIRNVAMRDVRMRTNVRREGTHTTYAAQRAADTIAM